VLVRYEHEALLRSPRRSDDGLRHGESRSCAQRSGRSGLLPVRQHASHSRDALLLRWHGSHGRTGFRSQILRHRRPTLPHERVIKRTQ
ncbi:hypothetical protein PENTCL1PPCAC_5475, partial [Pristionchus entomophagus]